MGLRAEVWETERRATPRVYIKYNNRNKELRDGAQEDTMQEHQSDHQ